MLAQHKAELAPHCCRQLLRWYRKWVVSLGSRVRSGSAQWSQNSSELETRDLEFKNFNTGINVLSYSALEAIANSFCSYTCWQVAWPLCQGPVPSLCRPLPQGQTAKGVLSHRLVFFLLSLAHQGTVHLDQRGQLTDAKTWSSAWVMCENLGLNSMVSCQCSSYNLKSQLTYINHIPQHTHICKREQAISKSHVLMCQRLHFYSKLNQ